MPHVLEQSGVVLRSVQYRLGVGYVKQLMCYLKRSVIVHEAT